jgi:serine/threonine protein kinase
VDIQFPFVVPADAQDLITKMLQKNPQDRLPLKKVMQHPFIIRCHIQQQPQQTNANDTSPAQQTPIQTQTQTEAQT